MDAVWEDVNQLESHTSAGTEARVSVSPNHRTAAGRMYVYICIYVYIYVYIHTYISSAERPKGAVCVFDLSLPP